MTATSTLNWDTVFAVPISEVNKAIKDQKSSPSTFCYSNGEDSVEGYYGDWEVVPGGDGRDIYMSLPIKNLKGNCSVGNFFCTNLRVIIEVELQYIPHDDNKNSCNLVLKTSSTTDNESIVSTKDVVLQDEITGTALDIYDVEIVKSILGGLIDACLTKNLSDFSHVFATVNLNDYIDKNDTWAWCKPSYVDYAYSDFADNPQKSILGILCMTGGRKASAAQLQQIDSFVIPENSMAGYLISPARVLLDLLLPVFPVYWKKANIDDFVFSENTCSETGDYQYVLSLKENASIELDNVFHDGTAYTPYIKELSISFDGTQLIFDTYTETYIEMGVSAWCKTTHYYNIELSNNSNGQTLIYKEVKPASESHGTKTSETTEIEKWIIIICSTIITIILGILTDGVAFFVSSLIVGFLTGVALSDPKMISVVNKDTSPSLDLMRYNLSKPIKWNNTDVFKLDYAGINNGLQLGGTLEL